MIKYSGPDLTLVYNHCLLYRQRVKLVVEFTDFCVEVHMSAYEKTMSTAKSHPKVNPTAELRLISCSVISFDVHCVKK